MCVHTYAAHFTHTCVTLLPCWQVNDEEISFGSATRSRAVVGCTTDLCSPSPCQNGGECLVSGSTFECRCPLGFAGNVCETGEMEDCPRDNVNLGRTGLYVAGVLPCT